MEAEALRELGWNVDALETDRSVRRRASMYRDFSQSSRARVLTDLNQSGRKYRLVTVTHVLEFIEDSKLRLSLLDDLRTRLTREGILLLSLRGWSDVNVAKVRVPHADGVITGLGTWTRGYSMEQAEELVKQAGLRVLVTPHGPKSKSPKQVRLVCQRV